MECASCDSGGGGCGGVCSCDTPIPERSATSPAGPRTCVKCKDEIAALTVGNQAEPICPGCLHASLLAKFKTAVNNNGLIASSDKVLVAFSGGSASRAALEFLKEIQLKVQSDAGAAKDRGLKVFGLGAVFVDEQTALQLSPSDSQEAVAEIRSIFPSGSGDVIPLHVMELESLYDSKQEAGLKFSDKTESMNADGKQDMDGCTKQKLLRLFQSVEDSTGKEDLLEYLRMEAIQKVAVEYGYTKVVLGLCTTRVAARVIAGTTKGQGFSLPAGIQYLDARWPVPVVLPLRDCVARELALFCHFSKFKTIFIKGLATMAGPRSSLNTLAHSFITLLQEDNPSRESTIVRTAAKLKSFSFNEVVELPSRSRRNPRASSKDFVQPKLEFADILCPICGAPVDKKYISNVGKTSCSPATIETETLESLSCMALEFRSTCCPSCCFQIIPEEQQKAIEKHGLLPKSMQDRGNANLVRQRSWMRSQVDPYLLQEEDDDSN